MVTCPLCNTGIDVDVDDLDEGDELICEDCGANLNVTGLDPLELSAADEDEDFDDDDDVDFDEDDDEDDDFDEDDEDDDEDLDDEDED